MTDRELLELAAKAAGMTVRIYEGMIVERGSDCVCVNEFGFEWNPIIDDGDALRIAVKLGLRVTHYPVYDEPKHSVVVDKPCGADFDCNGPDRCADVVELYNGDPYSATRRAIVRAAAEIGKAML